MSIHTVPDFLDSSANLIVNEKGHQSLSIDGCGSYLVSLNMKSVRGESETVIRDLVSKTIAEYRQRTDSSSGIVNLFKLMTYVRDINEGKGERELFDHILLEIYQYFPKTVVEYIPLIFLQVLCQEYNRHTFLNFQPSLLD